MVLVGRVEPVDILEARVSIAVAGPSREFRELEFVVDTGFSGELTLPESLIRELRLTLYRNRRVRIADNHLIDIPSYHGLVQWHGRLLPVLVYQSENPRPLLGAAMLENCRLTVDMREGGPVAITPLPH